MVPAAVFSWLRITEILLLQRMDERQITMSANSISYLITAYDWLPGFPDTNG